MILSSIILQTGLVKKLLNKENILGIDKAIWEILLISWISGFLIGPKFLNDIETEHNLTAYYVFASNAGIGFVISFIGITLWNNIYFGIYLYFIQILSSIIIFKFYSENKKLRVKKTAKAVPLITSISNSIQVSTKSMVEICGFTMFFSIIKNILISITKFGSHRVNMALSSLLEISGGAVSAITDNSNIVCSFFTGFSVGFGGLCMCFQVFSICTNKINFKKFIELKLLHGIICGVFSIIFVVVSNIEPIKDVFRTEIIEFNLLDTLINVIFIFFVLHFFKKFLKSKIN